MELPAFDDDELAERIVRNEQRFRDINDAIQSGRDRDDTEHRIGFVCECGIRDCARIVELTPAEYEDVRREPGQFVIVDGHDIPEFETVVARHERFNVVRKQRPSPPFEGAEDAPG